MTRFSYYSWKIFVVIILFFQERKYCFHHVPHANGGYSVFMYTENCRVSLFIVNAFLVSMCWKFYKCSKETSPAFTFDCLSKSTSKLLSSSHDIIFSSKGKHSWLMRSLCAPYWIPTTNLHCICEKQSDYICHLSISEILFKRISSNNSCRCIKD